MPRGECPCVCARSCARPCACSRACPHLCARQLLHGRCTHVLELPPCRCSHLRPRNQLELSGFRGEGLAFVRPLCSMCSAFTEEYGSGAGFGDHQRHEEVSRMAKFCIISSHIIFLHVLTAEVTFKRFSVRKQKSPACLCGASHSSWQCLCLPLLCGIKQGQ